MELEPRTDQLHREILGLLPSNLMDFSDLDAGRAQLMAMLEAAPVELPADVAVEDHHHVTADGHSLLTRLYRPSSAGPNSAALYWMHGGGLILGNVGMDDAVCASYASSVNAIVASVEYRLAPEHPFPAPLEDCYSGLVWLFAMSGELGIDPNRIAIGGASAGAGLAAGLALMSRDRGQVRPCFQLLRYPMIDDRNDTASSYAIEDQRVWNRSANQIAWSAYLGPTSGAGDVPGYAAPARAADLAGLPPALITVGDLDLFLDEDISYAQALLRAGVPTELHVYPGSFHGSDVMVPHADASQRWRRDEASALIRAFATA